MTQVVLNYAQKHPNDEVPTPEIWFRGMEKKHSGKRKKYSKVKLCSALVTTMNGAGLPSTLFHALTGSVLKNLYAGASTQTAKGNCT